MPPLAYQVTDWLSVGADTQILYGKFELRAAIPMPGAGDGRVKIEDADDVDIGFVGVVLFELAHVIRV